MDDKHSNEFEENIHPGENFDLGDLDIFDTPQENSQGDAQPVTKEDLFQKSKEDSGEIPARYELTADDGGSVRAHSKKKKILLISILALVAVLAACVIGVVVYYNSMLNRIHRPTFTENELSPAEIEYWATYNPDAEGQPEIETTAPAEETVEPNLEGDYITNILLIGQDYREGEATKLADSMILCSINRKTSTLTMTSFLRDSYIQMPNFKGHQCGMNRINVVYNLGWKWAGELGGMEMMDLCLKNNFGIEVDHNVEVSFDAFHKIIDLLDGIDVELTQAEVDYLKKDKTGFNDYVQEGVNHLDGYTALCYARARKLDGDVQRTARQRKVVTSVINRVKEMNIREINAMAKELLPMVTTDMSNSEITSLLTELLPMLPKLKIESGTCPAEGTYWGEMIAIAGYPSSVLKLDVGANRKRLMAICEVDAFEAAQKAGSEAAEPAAETKHVPAQAAATAPTEEASVPTEEVVICTGEATVPAEAVTVPTETEKKP